MFANLTLKYRILLSTLLYILFLTIPGCLATAYFYFTSAKFTATPKDTTPALIADRLSQSQLQGQKSIFGYVTTQDELFIESYQENSLEFNQQLNSLTQSQPSFLLDRSSLAELQILNQQLNDLNQHILNLMQAGKIQPALRTFTANENRQLFQKITAEIAKIRTAEVDWQQDVDRELQTSSKILTLTILIGNLLFATLAIILTFFSTNRILSTANVMISKLLNNSAAIAEEIQAHEQTIHDQTHIFSTTTGQIKDLQAFCHHSTGQTNLIYQLSQQISTKLVQISSQIERIKSLHELSDRLVDRSKKLSINVRIKALRENPETSKSFVLLNTELRALTNDAQKLAQKLNEILLESTIAEPNIVVETPTWGNHLSNHQTVNPSIDQANASQPSEPIDALLQASEQIEWEISELLLYSQQQTTNTEALLQTNEQLEQTVATTACGISETNLQTQKLKQVAVNLKLFLGI